MAIEKVQSEMQSEFEHFIAFFSTPASSYLFGTIVVNDHEAFILGLSSCSL